jgi:hypothetical protein
MQHFPALSLISKCIGSATAAETNKIGPLYGQISQTANT